jgi:phospholipid/cholesterol/gamma-HCH transport system substrate-binding protein
VVEFDVGDQVALVPPGPDYDKRVEEEIAKGLRARIKSEGLAGATVLSLEYVHNPAEYPPLNVPWKPRHLYIPSAPGQFSQIIASVNTLADSLKKIDFAKIGAQVQQDLQTAGDTIKHFDEVRVARLSTNVEALITDLRGVSQRIQTFVGPTNTLAHANLPTVATNADQALASVQQLAGKLDRMLANLDEASLNSSLQNIQRASQELEEAVQKFKEYPAATFFGKPPPPASSVVGQ